MRFDRLVKLLVLLLAVAFVFLKKYYFVLVIGVVAFIFYKLRLHEKIYKGLNQFTGNTLDYEKKVKERSKFMKFFNKQNKYDEEI